MRHVIAALGLGVLWFGAQSSSQLNAQQVQPRADGLTVLEIKPSIYLIGGAGANVVVHVGRDGVIVVDTGRADRADELLAEIRRLTTKPIRYIMNSSADAEHVGGNAVISAAGLPLTPTGYRREGFEDRAYATILAEEHVLQRMSRANGAQPPYPVAAWPTKTYSADAKERQRKLVLNGEGIQMMYQPAAHSDGDSLIYFRRADVLITGDLVDMRRFPMIDVAKGGSIQGLVDSLNRIVDMTFSSTPFPYQNDGTVIVPGHGYLCGTTEIIDYRDMVTIIRDRIADLIKKGMTLDQVQEANPTMGYRTRYGSDTGDWTTKMFVEAVYRSLTARGAQP
jgi:cyclase